jgi:hypothetical protein
MPSNAFRLKAALCFGRKKFQKFTYFAPNQILWAPSNKLGVSRTCTTYYAPTTPVAKKAASPAPPSRSPVVWQSEVRIARLCLDGYSSSKIENLDQIPIEAWDRVLVISKVTQQIDLSNPFPTKQKRR